MPPGISRLRNGILRNELIIIRIARCVVISATVISVPLPDYSRPSVRNFSVASRSEFVFLPTLQIEGYIVSFEQRQPTTKKLLRRSTSDFVLSIRLIDFQLRFHLHRTLRLDDQRSHFLWPFDSTHANHLIPSSKYVLRQSEFQWNLRDRSRNDRTKELVHRATYIHRERERETRGNCEQANKK